MQCVYVHANVHTHTCKRGYTKCGPPLRVHYLLVFGVSVVCPVACMCSVCHALLVFTLVSLSRWSGFNLLHGWGLLLQTFQLSPPPKKKLPNCNYKSFIDLFNMPKIVVWYIIDNSCVPEMAAHAWAVYSWVLEARKKMTLSCYMHMLCVPFVFHVI